jgi:anti-sigma regulatory factor (Ser/Thr protein kinase)
MPWTSSFMHPRKRAIRKLLVQLINMDVKGIVGFTSQLFGVSRSSIQQCLRELVNEGAVVAFGKTRNKTYALVPLREEMVAFPLLGLEEHRVWEDRVRPLLEGATPNILRICEYGFTEMLNNAIDHAEGSMVVIHVFYAAALIEFKVFDDGVGIFKKLKRALDLEDERHTILELTKGKLTTDPQRHTGEGIFFTSRMFDRFTIASGNLVFTHMMKDSDWLLDNADHKVEGTGVIMNIDPNVNRTTDSIFKQYTTENDEGVGFGLTKIPVVLAQYGDGNFVSRSQAKRLLAGLHRFKEIILDFERVETIGPAFADEIFRVFQRHYPDINVRWVSANETVEMMIRRARERAKESL